MRIMKNHPSLPCPHCKKDVMWSIDNIYRPFCSRQCKLIDLGDWLAERHVIAGEPHDMLDEATPDNTPVT